MVMPGLPPEAYINAVGHNPAFDQIDRGEAAVRRALEASGNSGVELALGGVTIKDLAEGNLTRVEQWEMAIRESDQARAEAVVAKAKEYPEMPSQAFRLTKADYLAAVVLVSGLRGGVEEGVADRCLQVMVEGNLFDAGLQGRGVALLELGRLENMRQQVMLKGGASEAAEALGGGIRMAVKETVEGWGG